MTVKKGAKNIIELKGIWKVYHIGEFPVNALQGIDLKVPQDDFLIILGPSGSGKSTMMNMVGALDVPTRGSVWLDGHNIAHLHESDLAQIRGRKIGFVFQQFNLVPILTAVQNVSLPMMFQDVSVEERDARARELLALVGLEHRMDHRPTEMSGGEQQRVAIARALANDPEVILADEPTGNLDSKTGEQIMDLILRLHLERKKTVVLITHDMNLIRHAHRVIYLKDGKVVKEEKRNRNTHND